MTEKKKSFSYPSFDVEWRPAFEVDKKAAFTKKYVKALERLGKGARAFTVATDYDVEGETIGYTIVTFLLGQKDAARMKFSTVTKGELREAYVQKRPTLDWGQAKAGTTRHVIDWLYGINLSRALTLAVKRAGAFKLLSSGRVQGPALKILVEREKSIAAFVPTPYWQVRIVVDKEGGVEAWHEKERFLDEEEAKKTLSRCEGHDAAVSAVERVTFRQEAPHPFDLSTLQAEAYRCFQFSPKRTLDIAQSLYTAGLTSYPRTSSQKLPESIGFKRVVGLLEKQERYASIAGKVLAKKVLKPRNGKKSDPAHPAIYPTGEVPKGLRDDELKLYDLIVKRFLATFGDAALRETVNVVFLVGGEKFKAKGTKTVERGWHELYDPYVSLKEEEFPPLQEGEVLKVSLLECLRKETKPPKRFTPASIIAELEKRGLGTKATRADIVESLYKRGYVVEKSMEVTPIGVKTVETLEERCPEILDEHLTREVEEELEKIREGKLEPETVIEDVKEKLKKILAHFKEHEQSIGKGLLEAEQVTKDAAALLGPCPSCKKGSLRILFSRKNKQYFVACDAYPSCKQTYPLPKGGKVRPAGKQCSSCSTPMVKVTMRRKTQTLCLNPSCPAKSEGKEEYEESLRARVGEPCPSCGEGSLVLRKGMFGSFLGCSAYPKCKGVVAENGVKKKEEKKEKE
ncbi:DNA topoisomerase I [Candidatus Woesearchaeota archaeon]|nr:MAG: DNA topoisomerase I [Candidatus Woesearchaeota archaeon]